MMRKNIEQKSALLSLLEGYKKSNELIIAEKKRRLAQLTEEDSLCEYDVLCKFWETNFKKVKLGKLEEQKIEFLINRRRLLNKVGGIKKSNDSAI